MGVLRVWCAATLDRRWARAAGAPRATGRSPRRGSVPGAPRECARLRPDGLGTAPIDGLVQARGYNNDDLDVTTEHLDGAGAAGGVVATARDVGVFLDALFDGKLVSAATVADMAAVHSMLFDTDSYGYGLDPATFSCKPFVGHTGDLHGFSTNAWRTVDGARTVVVIVNDEPRFDEVLPILTAALCPSTS